MGAETLPFSMGQAFNEALAAWSLISAERHARLTPPADSRRAAPGAHAGASATGGVTAPGVEPPIVRLVQWPATNTNGCPMRSATRVFAAAMLLSYAACARQGAPGTGILGAPTAPTASSPTGSAPGVATGGGVPLPFRPGGSGGVGGGNQPGIGIAGGR